MELMIDWETLCKALYYDPDAGQFIRLSNAGPAKVGDIAGGLSKEGYINVRVKGTIYKAHRLAWFYSFKEWPIHHIDHIDGDRANNRLNNLREVTPRENNFNRKVRSDNILGVKGVSKHTTSDKYVAQIQIDGKKQHIGLFNTIEEAAKAYELKAHELFGDYRYLGNTK